LAVLSAIPNTIERDAPRLRKRTAVGPAKVENKTHMKPGETKWIRRELAEKTVRVLRLGLALAVFCGAIGVARATVTYNFGGIANGGTNTDNLVVSANASFAVSNGKIVITLTNTTPHTFSAAELLTGLDFSLLNGTTAISNAALSSKTGIPRYIISDGTYTDNPPASNITWEEKNLTHGAYQLDFNPDAEYALVGPPDGDGLYHGNGSINGNPGHNPFTATVATFILTSSKIKEATTTISNVSFVY